MNTSVSLWDELSGEQGEQVKASLLAFIRSQTRCVDTADDVYQETLLRTNRRALFTELQSPLAYMITVAKSVIYDLHKKKPLQTSDWQEATAVAANDSVEETYLNQQKLDCIAAILTGMSALRREVFVMRRVDGLSRDAIAEAKGISVEAVKKHLTRAMVEITLKLEEAGWNDVSL